MEHFSIGEIVWGKIRGYPWWPAMVYILIIKSFFYLQVTGIDGCGDKKVFEISFIGDNTCANLKQKFIKKFKFELNEKTNIKKKDLLSAIEIACQLTADNNINKKDDSCNCNGTITTKPIFPLCNENNCLLNKKTKRQNYNHSNLLINKIILYVNKIASLCSIDHKKSFLSSEKQCILKVMDYLLSYVIEEPISFLKRTNLGKLVKYINVKLNNDVDIKKQTMQVINHFEKQILLQLMK